MKIKEILNSLNNVKPYEKGTHIMWTDKHISKHLLEAHINPDINVASRKSTGIDKVLDLIIRDSNEKCKDVLDLGCGPGLYTKKLAEKSYNVTGIDFSENSIGYAKKQVEGSNLNLKYICQNYLEMDFNEEFDLIIMIYCDFGVLSNVERDELIRRIYKALKPGGCFIFDSLNNRAIKNMSFEKQWDISEGGFWSENPYVALSQSLHFPDNKAVLDQHVIFDEDSNYKLYRFWNHYFDKKDIQNIFEKEGFKNIKEYTDILENDGMYNDEGVSFYKLEK